MHFSKWTLGSFQVHYTFHDATGFGDSGSPPSAAIASVEGVFGASRNMSRRRRETADITPQIKTSRDRKAQAGPASHVFHAHTRTHRPETYSLLAARVCRRSVDDCYKLLKGFYCGLRDAMPLALQKHENSELKGCGGLC